MDVFAEIGSLAAPLAVPAAVALVAIGIPLLVAGVRLWREARRAPRDLERALLVVRGFRRAVIGLCATVFGAAWLADVGWLMGLAAIIVGEETLECSVHIAALRDGCARARREAERASGSPAKAAPA
jgi:hypothetical protein